MIRTASGGGRGYGPTHSQSPENLLFGVPGLTVVFPSARHDPGMLLMNAVLQWPYPTVFFEHKLLYGEALNSGEYRKAEVSEEDPAAHLFPTLVSGSSEPDLTLIAFGGMAKLAETVAARLKEEEVETEIILPSLLSPLPRQTLLAALSGRERIAVIEESTAGWDSAQNWEPC